MTSPQLLASCWTHAGPAGPKPGLWACPLNLLHRIEIVAEAGFAGIGFSVFDIRQAHETIGLEALGRALGDHSLDHVELEFLDGWWDGRDTDDRLILLGAAEALGARHIKIGPAVDLTATAPIPQLEDFTTWAEALAQLGDEAAAAGTRVALEPQAMSNLADFTIADQLIRQVDHPAVGLALDIWHLERGPSELSELLSMEKRRVFCVELDDAGPQIEGSLYEDTVDRRVDCGGGVLDIGGFVSVLAGMGFPGPWGVEIISDDHRAQPVELAVPRSYTAAHEVLIGALST